MARHNLRKPTLETFLRRWWAQKYKLPWTHDLFGNQTPFELLVEYYEDYYEEDPDVMLGDMKGPNGEIVFSETGDELLDKWEEELAQGLTPDLEEGMSVKAKEDLKREREKKQSIKQKLAELAEPLKAPTQGSQAKAAPENPRYASKFVQPGSREEAQLLGHGNMGRKAPRQGQSQAPNTLGQEVKPRRGR